MPVRLAFIVLALLWVRPVRANMAAVRVTPSVVSGPLTAEPTRLRVEHERLTLDCSERRGQPVCEFEARYALSNPGDEPEEVAAAFYGHGLSSLRVSLDGAGLHHELGDEELRALDLAEKAAQESSSRASDRSGPKPSRVGFRVKATPRSQHELVVRGSITPDHRFVPSGYVMDAIEGRHILLQPKIEKTPPTYDLEYLLSPIRTWQGDPMVDVRITYPSRWQVGRPDRLNFEELSPAWTRSEDGDRTTLTRTLRAREDRALSLVIRLPKTVVRTGGLLLGIGGATGANGGVRGRIGYEMAAPGWMLYSATMDTDFTRRIVLTPLIEAASPSLLILPSFGIGIGLPVQVTPDVRVGVRFQADLHLYALGFVTSVDVYPAREATPTTTQATFLFQVGL